MQLKPPKPETTQAFLVSAGYPTPRGTSHHHYETRPTTIVVPQLDGTLIEEPVWEHVFKCFETGVERRWGIQAREEGLVN
jgi:hypothetical protein